MKVEIWLFAGSGEGYGMGDIHHLKASVFLTVPEARRGEARRGEAGVGGGVGFTGSIREVGRQRGREKVGESLHCGFCRPRGRQGRVSWFE